jgi:hypothetical protein
MTTLLLTNGDLHTSGGLQLLSDLGDETTQRLQITLRFFQGEWFQDPRIGMPYFEKVLIKAPKLAEVRSIFRRAILADPAVETLNSLNLDFDRGSRTLSVSFEATLTDGSNLVFEDFILPEAL